PIVVEFRSLGLSFACSLSMEIFSGQTMYSPNLGLVRVWPPFCFPRSVKIHLSLFLSIQPNVFSLENKSLDLMSRSFASAEVEMYSIILSCLKLSIHQRNLLS